MQSKQNPWDSTTKDIRSQISRLLLNDSPGVVVTVIDVEGSAYRRPGAKMIIDEEGSSTGAVTAGCLEDQVQSTARKVLDTRQPRTEVYDMMDDDSGGWGLGLGCDGVITLLYEPIDSSWRTILTWLEEGKPVQVASMIESERSIDTTEQRMAWVDQEWYSLPCRSDIPTEVRAELSDVVSKLNKTGKTLTTTVSDKKGDVTIAVESMEPTSEIILFGSQNDIYPISKLASMVGFNVIVYSPRGATSESEFPDADTVITGHPSDITNIIDHPEHTYPVIMSHNLVDDIVALETLLEETSITYIGLMGPQDRFDKIQQESDIVQQAEYERIATPIGLDLGGGSPIKIGTSIVSEILTVSNGKKGGRLVHKKGPIHSRIK